MEFEKFEKKINLLFSEGKLSEEQKEHMLQIKYEESIKCRAININSIEEKITTDKEFGFNSFDKPLFDEKISEVLNKLTLLEQKVIKIKFGFEDGCVHSNEEISKMLNMSCEDVSSIENEALKKLRNPSVSNIIKDYRDYDSSKNVNTYVLKRK